MAKPAAAQHQLRSGRYSEPGQAYFVTTVTKGRRPVFTDHRAAQIVVDTLKWMNDRSRIRLMVAVVMPDHLHFVAGVEGGTVATMMHSVKSFSAQRINRVLGRSGAVWARQYYEHAIRDERELDRTILYCLENPMRQGLVDDFHAYPHWYCRYDV